MAGPSDSDDGKRLTNSRRDFLHLSGIGAMGLSGIGTVSGPAFAQSSGSGGSGSAIGSGSVIFSDSFEDGNLDEYDVMEHDASPGGSPHVEGFTITTDASDGNYGVRHKTEKRALRPKDDVRLEPPVEVTIDCKFTFLSGVDFHLQWDSDKNLGYQVAVRSNYGPRDILEVAKLDEPFKKGPTGTTTKLKRGRTESAGFPLNSWFQLKIRWLEDGTIEAEIPSTGDQVSMQDDELSGHPFLIGGYHFDGTGHFDNVVIRDGVSSGSRVLEDFEDFEKSRYGGDVSKFGRTTAPVQQGSYAGELTKTDDTRLGAHTTDTTIEAPITLRGWMYKGEGTSTIVSFFTQSEDSIPECLDLNLEHDHGTFEMNYEDGSGGWGGDEFAITSFDFSADTWYEFEIDVNEDASLVTATLYDANGTRLEQISGTPPKQLTSGGFGFGVGGSGTGSVYFDDYRVEGTPEEKKQKVTPRQEPVDGVTLDNGRGDDLNKGNLALEVSELESADWSLGDGSGLFYEGFALVAGDEIVPSYEPSSIEQPMVGEIPVNTWATGSATYEIAGAEFRVIREARIHPANDQVKFRYEVEQISGSNVDVDFVKYADFDLDGPSGDRANYSSTEQFVYQTNEAESVYGGIKGWMQGLRDNWHSTPSRHHLGPYSEYDALEAAELEERAQFPETGFGDPVSMLEFSLTSTAPGDDTDRLQFVVGFEDSRGELEGLLNRILDVQRPVPADLDLPPTAVELDEFGRGSVTFETGDWDIEDVDFEVEVTDRYRGNELVSETVTNPQTTVLRDSATEPDLVSVSYVARPVAEKVTDLSDSAARQLPVDDDGSPLPDGWGYELTFRARTADNEVVEQTSQTYAFRWVSNALLVPIRGSGQTSLPATGSELFADLREQAEQTNEYFASGLSTMGAHGMNFLLPTRDDSQSPDGWIELPRTYDDYVDASNPRNEMQEDGTDEIRRSPYTDLIDGRKPTPVFLYTIDPSRSDNGSGDEEERVNVGGGEYFTNSTQNFHSRVVCRADGAHWLHELSHRLGFPDLYTRSDQLDEDDSRIGDWGMMGSGDALPEYLQLFWDWERWTYPAEKNTEVSDLEWLTEQRTELFSDGETSVQLTEATVKSLGDTADAIAVRLTVDTILEKNDISDFVYETVETTRYFVPEARRSELTYLENPDGGRLRRSPDPEDDDGVALFTAGEQDPTSHAPDDPFLRYLPPMLDFDSVFAGNRPAEATLKEGDSGSSLNEVYYDVDTATLFQWPDHGFNDGRPEITLVRSADPAGDGSPFGIFSIQATPQLAGFSGVGSSPAVDRPGLDVMAETPDGRRVGRDPETGYLVNEIDGARISGPLNDRWITVPLDETVTVSVSDSRLREFLVDQIGEAPEAIKYTQTVITEIDPTLGQRDGIAYIDGRLRRETTATTSQDGAGPLLTTADVTVEPESIATASNGQFVTVYLSFEGNVDPSQLRTAGVSLGTVGAVADPQYGFVSSPETGEDGPGDAMVKFDRSELIDNLGTSKHALSVTGPVGETTFVGRAELEIRDAGGRSNKAGGQGNDNGRGGGAGN